MSAIFIAHTSRTPPHRARRCGPSATCGSGCAGHGRTGCREASLPRAARRRSLPVHCRHRAEHVRNTLSTRDRRTARRPAKAAAPRVSPDLAMHMPCRRRPAPTAEGGSGCHSKQRRVRGRKRGGAPRDDGAPLRVRGKAMGPRQREPHWPGPPPHQRPAFAVRSFCTAFSMSCAILRCSSSVGSVVAAKLRTAGSLADFACLRKSLTSFL